MIYGRLTSDFLLIFETFYLTSLFMRATKKTTFETSGMKLLYVVMTLQTEMKRLANRKMRVVEDSHYTFYMYLTFFLFLLKLV
jgi:hypothetical protein